MSEIELTPWLRRQLFYRAEAEAPEECCGLISQGVNGIALWAAENMAPFPDHEFVIEPGVMVAVAKQAFIRREKIVGLYHSHPGGEPAPSPEDLRMAAGWPGLVWVLIATGEGREPTYFSGRLA